MCRLVKEVKKSGILCGLCSSAVMGSRRSGSVCVVSKEYKGGQIGVTQSGIWVVWVFACYGVTEGVVGGGVVISVCCGVKWLRWLGVDVLNRCEQSGILKGLMCLRCSGL